MQPYPADLITYYSGRASYYEDIYHRPERAPALDRLRFEVHAMFSGRRVLEIACGTGYWTKVLSEACASLTATDAGERVLSIASTRKYTIPVRFMRADAYDLTNVDANFDGGFSGFWWSHVPRSRLRAFIRGFLQKLKTGSRVCFIDNCFIPGTSTASAREDEEGNTYQMRHLRDGTKHLVLKNYPTPDEIIASLDPFAYEFDVEFGAYYWRAFCRSSLDRTNDQLA